jgi:type I restriction enzyme, S subunit
MSNTNAARRHEPYPAYKDSGIEWLGQIPAHWEAFNAGRIVTRIEQGWSPVADDRRAVDGEWAVIKLSAVAKGSFVPSEHKALPSNVPPVERYEIHDGDILLTRANTPELVGDLCVVRNAPPRLMLCDLVYRLTLSRDRVVPEFLAYWLLSPTGRHQIEVEARGSSQSMVKVTHGLIRAWTVVVPSPSEQRAIVHLLDRETARIDALVAKNERLIELLQEKRTALITRAVTGGQHKNVRLVDSGSVVFPRLPGHWKLRKLRRVITQVKRPVAVDPDAEYREIGIRSWGKGLFHKDPVRGELLEDKSVFRIEPDDFVLNIVFAWEGAVGIATANERGMVASHRFPTFRCVSDVDLNYFLMVLQTDQGRGVMEINSPGAAGRNRTIRLGQFLEEEIPIAPLPEQRAIASSYRSDERRIRAFASKVREAVDRLKEYRAALISAAVTGKIDVRGESAAGAVVPTPAEGAPAGR